jgi:ABC-type sulfate transport system permease component
MTGAAILAPGLLALGAAFCFAHAVGLLGIVVSVAGVVLLLVGT